MSSQIATLTRCTGHEKSPFVRETLRRRWCHWPSEMATAEQGHYPSFTASLSTENRSAQPGHGPTTGVGVQRVGTVIARTWTGG